MHQPVRRRAVFAAGLALAAPRPACAQGADWPTRPIRMILPYAAGGPTDVIARVLADALSQRLPQRVVVENRTGAGGNIGASAAAKSAPDGATFLFTNTGHAVNRSLYTRLDYDPATDLVPVSIIAESPMVLLVPNDLPARDVAGLVAQARAQPNALTYASAGSGGALQLVSLLFLQAAGLQMQEVPYRGSAPAMQDLIAGRLHMLYDAGITAFPLATTGQARALAVSSARRSAVMPDVPTIGEDGFPTATFSVWQGVLAPRGTPQPIIDGMQQAIAGVLAEPALRRRLTELGAETILGNSPAEAQRYVAAEMERWQGVLRAAGIQPQ
jgi:tripartite-type tricarboxylate transporter receptor subunit TctC